MCATSLPPVPSLHVHKYAHAHHVHTHVYTRTCACAHTRLPTFLSVTPFPLLTVVQEKPSSCVLPGDRPSLGLGVSALPQSLLGAKGGSALLSARG